MKQCKRTGIYKASNVAFDPNKVEASSYNWWIFVKKIKGKVVFNDYRYSVTTRKHQSKVRHLMDDLGIKIDLVIRTRQSLSDFSKISEVKDAHAKSVRDEAELAEIKRRQRNENARQRRIELKQKQMSKAIF